MNAEKEVETWTERKKVGHKKASIYRNKGWWLYISMKMVVFRKQTGRQKGGPWKQAANKMVVFGRQPDKMVVFGRQADKMVVFGRRADKMVVFGRQADKMEFLEGRKADSYGLGRKIGDGWWSQRRKLTPERKGKRWVTKRQVFTELKDDDYI